MSDKYKRMIIGAQDSKYVKAVSILPGNLHATAFHSSQELHPQKKVCWPQVWVTSSLGSLKEVILSFLFLSIESFAGKVETVGVISGRLFT